MRTRTWKFAAIMSIVAATFTACDKDDDEYYVADGGTWLSYGNLEKVGNAKQADYAIRRDDGSRLLVVEGTDIDSKEATDGMRVYSQYAILASERDAEGLEGHMNYYVRLYNIAKVLTKSPVKESFILADETNRQDSIGNDPINLSEAWFGGKYLNVEFTMPVKNNSGVKHFINIVEDDVTVHNDTVYLTLRHNAYGDKPEAGNRKEDSAYRWVWGNASFDLTSILPEGATSVPVKLVWTAYKKDSSETEQLSDSGLYTLLPQSKASVSGGLNAKNVSGKKGQGNARVERMICR